MSFPSLVEKGAEAASEAQDNVLLRCLKALGAGCPMNRFFNKLLGAVYRPNQRARRLEPKWSLSARRLTAGS